jgi:hypothetical protein
MLKLGEVGADLSFLRKAGQSAASTVMNVL